MSFIGPTDRAPNEDVPQSKTVLVRELDVVIDETRDRIAENLEKVERMLDDLRSDWTTYRSSLSLRNRFAHGAPREVEFSEVMRLLSRFHAETFRREQRSAARAPSFASRRVRTIEPAPGDRIEQIRKILSAQDGEPMDTGAIATAMERRGWLIGVTDTKATVSAALSRGHRLGVFERVSRGMYQLAPLGEQGRGSDGGDQDQSMTIAQEGDNRHGV